MSESLESLMASLLADGPAYQWSAEKMSSFPLAMGAGESLRRELTLRLASHATELKRQHGWGAQGGQHLSKVPEYRTWMYLNNVVLSLAKKPADWRSQNLDALLSWVESGAPHWWSSMANPQLLNIAERLGASGLSARAKAWLGDAVERERNAAKPDQKWIARAREILGEEAPGIELDFGEPWAASVRDHIAGLDPSAAAAWTDLISHCKLASGGTPTAKWLKLGSERLKQVGASAFSEAVNRWFPLVEKGRTFGRQVGYSSFAEGSLLLTDASMEALKGLCWLAGGLGGPELVRALGRLALTSYKKVPGVGPRAVRVGNAAVHALGATPGMEALGQLAMLRVKVKFGGAQKALEKALNASAEREGLPREEIDELGVPSYGLTEVGKLVEEIGEYRAELAVTGIGDTEIRYFKAGSSKGQASVPAAMKATHAEELKDIKAAAKDIGSMLPAQRDRIDSLYLERRSWPVEAWRQRYLDHPLVGVLARRLIWRVSEPGGREHSVAWLDGAPGLVDLEGRPVAIGPECTVRLWHPIEVAPEEVQAWRRFFEDRQIRQPFKQAHREVYLLTDAERRTETYSNRFAAHILKQHQFNALCAVRGWKNKLRLMVDAEYPPATRHLRAWDLRAEFWIEGIGDEYGRDTNEAGVYLHLTTDQVRFYAQGAAQLTAHAGGGGYGNSWGQPIVAAAMRIDEVPALVLSEVLRDVDLFVGVCSVANNPQWSDGGPGGAHRDYWWTRGFGDLSETGSGRRDLLQRLVPRLKIAGACSFADNFLVVRGKLRTYKIHLGSGNILMEPSDQYLCIVPSSRDETEGTASQPGRVFLPFEGDRTLSIILSKAFLLAEDDKITDPTITRQIAPPKV